MTAIQSLREHWPEYAIEGWALGMFMVSASAVATLLEYPASPLHAAVPSPHTRLAIAGVAMGLTAIALIHSPWGRRSGAHMNPAVTLTFWRLGKIKRWDAVFYVAAQFIASRLVFAPMWTGPIWGGPGRVVTAPTTGRTTGKCQATFTSISIDIPSPTP